ncbi:MAG: hypothetical protein AAF677_14545 [Pseudomonadota bacterium]
MTDPATPPPGPEGRDAPFFIGFLPVPPALRGFLALAGVVALLAAGALGYLVAATQDDPGTGGFAGRQQVTGVLIPGAYPLLQVTEGTEALPAGRTVMLAGIGKFGVQNRVNDLGGQLVRADGIMVQRGDLQVLQLRGARDAIAAVPHATPPDATPSLAAAPPAPAATRRLGRWRLTGELCDGKCYAGAMRPGRGISHRACANLCIIGGVPMVFVATGEVQGHAFFLVTGPAGEAVDRALLDAVAELIEIEGEIEIVAGMPVLRADPASIARP